MKLGDYNHLTVEANLYQSWLNSNVFSTDLKSPYKNNFTIIMPPPNITGNLHLGHSYENVIQDAIARFMRLQNKNVLFVPGFDHAGIAAQKKMVEALGLTTDTVSYEQLHEYAQQWHDKYVTNIKQQWAALGLSVNYDCQQYTLNDLSQLTVRNIFKSLYDKKLIYNAKKIINHDVVLQTSISDLEVDNRIVNSNLYYVKYFFPNQTDFVVIATSRPETIFADNCLLVSSNDKRYAHLVGKKVINPLTKKLIPICTSSIVDSEYGTGVVKCTPAHDFNDFSANLELKLPYTTCLNVKGKMINVADEYLNLDRFACRKLVVKNLQALQHLSKIEPYQTTIKYSSRTDTVVEPLVTEQWFLATSKIAQKLLTEFNDSNSAFRVAFHPVKFKNTFINWLKNMQDWCISRQIIWGTRLPLAFNKEKQEFVYCDDKLSSKNFTLLTDVLDTWFNSSLWPLTTLQYYAKDQTVYKNFFPSNLLVTGYDIILFWVARMIMQSYEQVKLPPFKDVLIHGLVRDKHNKKMSKMLNNGIDPSDLVAKYGADAVRFYLLSSSKLGEDIRFNEVKLRQAKTFIIKIWNVHILIKHLSSQVKLNSKLKFDFKAIASNDYTKAIFAEFKQLMSSFQQNINQYQFNLAALKIVDFIYNSFANRFCEIVKLNFKNASLAQDNQLLVYTANTLWFNFLRLFSCFAPFVSNYLLDDLQKDFSFLKIMPFSDATYQAKNTTINNFWAITSTIRQVKKWLQWDDSTLLDIKFAYFKASSNKLANAAYYISNLTKSNFTFIESYSANNFVSVPIACGTLLFEAHQFENNPALKVYLHQVIKKIESEISRSKNKLSNQAFLQNAKADLVKLEQDKYHDYLQQFEILSKFYKINNKN